MEHGIPDADLTLEETITILPSTSNIDMLIRVRKDEQSGTEPSDLFVTSAPTEQITRPIMQLIDEHSFLKEVVKNLWRVYKYHQEYESFLLGGYTEEEFIAIAEQHAIVFQNIPLEILIWASSFLLNILTEITPELTTSELSVLLNVDPSGIESALSSSLNINVLPSSPENTDGK